MVLCCKYVSIPQDIILYCLKTVGFKWERERICDCLITVVQIKETHDYSNRNCEWDASCHPSYQTDTEQPPLLMPYLLSCTAQQPGLKCWARNYVTCSKSNVMLFKMLDPSSCSYPVKDSLGQLTMWVPFLVPFAPWSSTQSEKLFMKNEELVCRQYRYSFYGISRKNKKEWNPSTEYQTNYRNIRKICKINLVIWTWVMHGWQQGVSWECWINH